jgi:hypothetical protein
MKCIARITFFIGVIVFIGCGFLIYRLLGTSGKNVPPALTCDCDEAVFDMKRIPVKEGKAVGSHKFKIFNNTGSVIKIKEVVADCSCASASPLGDIPGKGMRELEVFLRFSAGDLMRHSSRILVIPENNKIPRLELEILGGADFSSHLSRTTLDFGKCHFFETKTLSFEVYCANEEAFENSIKEVKVKNNDLLKAIIKETERTPQTLYDGTVYYLHRSKIDVVFAGGKTLQAGNGRDEISIFLENGEIHKLEVLWELYKKTVFDRETFYLIQLKSREERKFNVIYNSDIGGKPKNIKAIGKGLSVLSTEEREKSISINLKYLSTKAGEIDEKLGELIVETEDGKRHVLPVVAL